MGGDGGQAPPELAEALARRSGVTRAMPRFTLMWRLGVRFRQAVSPDGAARRGRWRWLNLAFAGADVALWAVDARRNRRGDTAPGPGRGPGPRPAPDRLAARLPLAALDQAVWTTAPAGQAEIAGHTTVPLAFEAGLRRGAVGVGIPVMTAGLSAAAARARGRPVDHEVVSWPLVGGVCGAVGRAIESRWLAAVLREHDEQRSAEQAIGRLAGQHAVAMGADSVVDAIEALLPLIGRPTTGSALFHLADAWKSSLAAETSRHATYLAVSLRKWEMLHNLHPDLSSHVEILLPEGDGTKLLSGTQERALFAALDGLHGELRGPVRAGLASGHTLRPPGEAFTLEIGERAIGLPSDGRSGVHTFDYSALVFLLGAVWLLADVPRTRAHVPLGYLAPCAIGSLGAAAWVSRAPVGSPRPARHVVGAAIGIAAAHAVLSSRFQRSPLSLGGRRRLPFVASLFLPGVLLELRHRDLDARQRRTGWAAMALTGAAGFAALSHRPGWRDSLVEVDSLAGFVALAHWLRHSIEQHGAALHTAFERDADQAREQGLQEGRALVVDLVQQAVVEAHERFAAIEDRLATADAAVVRRRLADVEHRAAELA